jgi:hypothetical protein
MIVLVANTRKCDFDCGLDTFEQREKIETVEDRDDRSLIAGDAMSGIGVGDD